jgi:hypothetical protein
MTLRSSQSSTILGGVAQMHLDQASTKQLGTDLEEEERNTDALEEPDSVRPKANQKGDNQICELG